VAECGHLVIPEALTVLNPSEAFCPKCGQWVKLERKAQLSEWMAEDLGIQPYLVPDEPPF